jgi:ubiquitin-conjugating enzyme E2 D/E
MGAVNALFSAFADKTLAFEYNHLVKLVCFSSTIEDKCDFMNDFNKFILLVDGADAGGSTRCYDAIDYAIT